MRGRCGGSGGRGTPQPPWAGGAIPNAVESARLALIRPGPLARPTFPRGRRLASPVGPIVEKLPYHPPNVAKHVGFPSGKLSAKLTDEGRCGGSAGTPPHLGGPFPTPGNLPNPSPPRGTPPPPWAGGFFPPPLAGPPPPQGKAIGKPCGAYCRKLPYHPPNVAKARRLPLGGKLTDEGAMWRIGGERNPAATLGRWGYSQRCGICKARPHPIRAVGRPTFPREGDWQALWGLL